MTVLKFLLIPPVVVNAAKVALVVGTCLNAINQGPQFWNGDEIEWSKFALNYLVPYLVASYSAARALATQAASVRLDK